MGRDSHKNLTRATVTYIHVQCSFLVGEGPTVILRAIGYLVFYKKIIILIGAKGIYFSSMFICLLFLL